MLDASHFKQQLHATNLANIETPGFKRWKVSDNFSELDKELLEVNRNSMHYQFLTQMTSSSIKHLNLAIKGRA